MNDITHRLELSPEVVYDVTSAGAVFRNGVQVVIPQQGADVVRELAEVVNHVAEIQGLDYPVITPAPDAPDIPDAETRYEVEGTGPNDITWKGFEVKGYFARSGVALAQIEHPEVGVVLNLSWPTAQIVIDEYDQGEMDEAYELLCAKAFMAWFDRNGLTDEHKEVQRPVAPPLVPDWEPGATVKHRHLGGVYGVVWLDPSTKERVLMDNTGNRIQFTMSRAGDLLQYEEVQEEMGQ